MKPIHQYVCLVDTYRRPSRTRNTYGRYRVGAKTEKEAKELLQKAIQFGSVQVYYEDTNPPPELIVSYKEIKKEINYINLDKTATSYLTKVKAATEKQIISNDSIDYEY